MRDTCASRCKASKASLREVPCRDRDNYVTGVGPYFHGLRRESLSSLTVRVSVNVPLCPSDVDGTQSWLTPIILRQASSKSLRRGSQARILHLAKTA